MTLTPVAKTLKIVFDPRDERHFFIDAYINGDHRLDLSDIYGMPSFRSVCIALLLAKILGQTGEKKVARMRVNALSDTWISTLAGTRMESDPYWFVTHFKTNKLFNAKRGSPPYVEYIHSSLSLSDLNFYYGTRGGIIASPLGKEEMTSYARELDENGIWGTTSVNEILGIKQIDWQPSKLISGIGKHTDAASEKLPRGSRKPQLHIPDFTKVANELCYHIRRSGGQRCAIKLLQKESISHPTLKNAPLTKYGDTPLLLAISLRKKYLADFLFTFPGVDLSCKNRKGVTPALKAAGLNDSVAIAALVGLDADMTSSNYQRANGIHETCFGATDEAQDIMRRFELKRVNPMAVCLDGTDALDIALARKAPEELIDYLKRYKYHNVEEYSKSHEGISDDVLIRIYDGFRRGNYEKAVDLIFEAFHHDGDTKKPDWNLLPKQLPTSLFRAILENDTELVGEITLNQKNSLIQDDIIYRCSPLHFAAERGLPEIVELLLAAGADPFAQNNHGRTPRELLPNELSETGLRILQALKKHEALWVAAQFESGENVVP